jgi:hypothetical protein
MTKARDLSQVPNASLGFKNRIINGDMTISQRNGSSAVTINDTAVYTVDRWFGEDVTDGAFTVQQVADAPAGFSFSSRITITTADTSLAAGQYAVFVQRIEGFNTADLAFGTADASPITLSFRVKSSLTGTFGGVVSNGAENYSYPFTYTISSANTWETKSITITGATAGTWVGATNGRGLVLAFSLGSGSTYTGTAGAWVAADDRGGAIGQTNIISTNGATWQVTGVQLEKGSTATSFDYRPYGTELALCQRYFYSMGGTAYEIFGFGAWRNSTTACIHIKHSVPMRVQPTLNVINLANMWFIGSGINTATSALIDQNDLNATMIDLGGVSGTYSNFVRLISGNNTSTRLQLSSEL